MNVNSEGPYWSSKEAWKQVNQTLTDLLLHQDRKALKILSQNAKDMAREMAKLDKLMQGLCNRTCPNCLGICCHARTISYDFLDLLYIHLIQAELPPQQTRQGPKQPCCYLTEKGCTLERDRRPFICSWFICQDQEDIISRMLWGKETKLIKRLDKLLVQRRRLESDFIKMVA